MRIFPILTDILAVHCVFCWHMGDREARERSRVSGMRDWVLLYDPRRDPRRSLSSLFEWEVLKRHTRSAGERTLFFVFIGIYSFQTLCLSATHSIPS